MSRVAGQDVRPLPDEEVPLEMSVGDENWARFKSLKAMITLDDRPVSKVIRYSVPKGELERFKTTKEDRVILNEAQDGFVTEVLQGRVKAYFYEVME